MNARLQPSATGRSRALGWKAVATPFIAAGLLLAGLSVAPSASAATGTISGTYYFWNGSQRLGGAYIEVLNPSGGRVNYGTTRSDGYYIFTGLPQKVRYTIKAASQCDTFHHLKYGGAITLPPLASWGDGWIQASNSWRC